MRRIAVFASGSGTNAENIIKHFGRSEIARVQLLLANDPKAYALKRAGALGVEAVTFDRADLYENGRVLKMLAEAGIDYVVLAGFLWLVPQPLIERYRGRIINIHPALLPKYGGKGMYGGRVHKAVVEAGEKESGITIHHVNEVYDSGSTIAQFTVDILPGDTPEVVAQKVHQLEYAHFPGVIEEEIRRIFGE